MEIPSAKICALHQTHWFVSACHFSYKDVPVHMLNLEETGNLRLSNFKAAFGKHLYVQQADLVLNKEVYGNFVHSKSHYL